MVKKENPTAILNKISSVYIALMLSVYVLYTGLGGYAVITDQKWPMLCWISGAYIVAVVLLRLELAAVGAKKLGSPVEAWKMLPLMHKLLQGFWLCSLVSALLSDNAATALLGTARHSGLLTITLYLLVFFFVSQYGKFHFWYLDVFGAAVTLNCVLSLVQLCGYNPLNLYPEGMNFYDGNVYYSGQFLGTIGNADLQSAFLCLAIPALAVAVWKCKERRRFRLLVPLVLGVITLLLSGVAGGAVGLIGTCIIGIPVLIEDKKCRRSAWITSGGICIAGLLAVYLIGPSMSGTVYELSQVLRGNIDNSFGSSRIYIWRKVLPLAAERPLFGGGPDTLGLRLNTVFERYSEELGFVVRSSVDVAHNEYLNILVNQGALALGFYIAALISAAVRWIRRSAEDPAVALCGAAALGYCLQAFFGIESPAVTPLFAIVLGAI